MKKPRHWILFLLMALGQCALAADSLKLGANATPVLGQPGQQSFLPVEEAYRLLPRREGDSLLLEWDIAPGYYLYRDSFAATLADGDRAGLELDKTFDTGVVRYDDYFERDVEVYYGETTVVVALAAEDSADHVQVVSQGCADAGLCYPPRTQYVALRGDPVVLDQLPATQPSAGPGGAGDSLPLLLVLGLAMLGGLILNLMPCVFPVLSIKVLSLSQHHVSSRGRHSHGLAYSLGVILSFVAIAAALIGLRAGGEALGWGFQLQSPGFITALVFLFFVMGLGFSGFIEAGARLMNLGQSAGSGGGLRHSFLTGVLATVVASPCTAPFMGTALGFALTQSSPVALLVFAFLGLGMALPFLLLTWAPALLNRIPRPGPWMDVLKQLLAFPLYLTCVWLLWVLGNQTDATTTAFVLCGLVLVTLAFWLARFAAPVARVTALLVLVAAIALPVRELTADREPPFWEPYTPARLENLLTQRRAVFVNLTADWCITCLANERVALGSDEFRELLADRDITYLKGDWTNSDPDITALLNANGRSGVPLYLFYAAGDRNPVILPQILTNNLVREALTAR